LSHGEAAVMRALFSPGNDTVTLEQENAAVIDKARDALKTRLSQEYEKSFFFTNVGYFSAGLMMSLVFIGACVVFWRTEPCPDHTDNVHDHCCGCLGGHGNCSTVFPLYFQNCGQLFPYTFYSHICYHHIIHFSKGRSCSLLAHILTNSISCFDQYRFLLLSSRRLLSLEGKRWINLQDLRCSSI